MHRCILVVFFLLGLVPVAAQSQPDDTPGTTDRPEISERAWDVLTRMTETISGSQAFTIVAEMGHEVLLPNGQRLEFGSTITATIKRPSQANVHFKTREGDNATIVLDGENIAVFSTRGDEFIYDTTSQPGDINSSFEHLTQVLGSNDQLRGLFSVNLTETLAAMVTSADYIGEATIAGVRCDNLALRSEYEDVQLWVEQGDAPLPRRLIVTYRYVEGQPQFWVQYSAWNLSPEFSDSTFRFSPPEHAEQVEFFSQPERHSATSRHRAPSSVAR